MLIRGPDVPQNVVSEQVHSHTDMAPTILNMLGVPLRNNFDGQPIDYQQPDNSVSGMSEFVNVEFWDNKVPLEWDGTQFIGIDGDVDGAKGESYNNTYKSLRMQSSGHSFYYSVWCDGSHEFYDMTVRFPTNPWNYEVGNAERIYIGGLLPDEQPVGPKWYHLRYTVLQSSSRAAFPPFGHTPDGAQELQDGCLPQPVAHHLSRQAGH